MANEDILVQFGQRVRELRKKRAMTQEQLALESGIERAYVSDLERGRRNLAIKNVHKIATAFGITLSELFEGVK